MERLDKIISSQTIYSRKEIKELIRKKRITVNGEIILKSDYKINPEIDKIKIDQEEIQIKNTIGCGDSFNAGFLYEYLSSKSLAKSLEMGTFAASRNAENIAPGCIL